MVWYNYARFVVSYPMFVHVISNIKQLGQLKFKHWCKKYIRLLTQFHPSIISLFCFWSIWSHYGLLDDHHSKTTMFVGKTADDPKR